MSSNLEADVDNDWLHSMSSDAYDFSQRFSLFYVESE